MCKDSGMGRFQLVRNGQEKERQEFLPLIGMKYLTDIGGRHPHWLGYPQLCCEPAYWNWHFKTWPALSVERTTLCYPQHRIIESVNHKLEKTFNVFVIRAQMHETCCRFPDLEQGSWICTSPLKFSWQIWPLSWHIYKEQEPKPASPALQALATGL